MHRTEGTNNQNNLFTDGPPGTAVDAAWLNSIQEEIVKVIDDAGIKLKERSNDTRDQLSSAITTVVNNSIVALVGTENIEIDNTDSPYTIGSTTKSEIIIYVNSSGGNVSVTLPLLANTFYKKIRIVHSVGGNLLTINRGGSDLITKDDLTSIELPLEQNFVEFIGSVSSNRWEILDEHISAGLWLYGYGGYGTTDNKIAKYTTVDSDYGNLFAHNHGTYGTAGLEITINRKGKYAISKTMWHPGGFLIGISRNSSQLTTSISGINYSDVLAQDGGSVGVGGNCSVTIWLDKNTIIRPHGSGVVVTFSSFGIEYVGN